MVKEIYYSIINNKNFIKMKKKDPKDEIRPNQAPDGNKFATETSGHNNNDNSKAPAPDTTTHIAAGASTVRDAKDAAGKVDEIAKGGGTPIADMQPEAQVVALTALARAMKGNEPSVSEEEFIKALRNVPYKRAKKALKAAGTPAATREHILEKVYGKK